MSCSLVFQEASTASGLGLPHAARACIQCLQLAGALSALRGWQMYDLFLSLLVLRIPEILAREPAASLTTAQVTCDRPSPGSAG